MTIKVLRKGHIREKTKKVYKTAVVSDRGFRIPSPRNNCFAEKGYGNHVSMGSKKAHTISGLTYSLPGLLL